MGVPWPCTHHAGAQAEYNELLVDDGMPYEAALAAMQDALADMRAENAPEDMTSKVLPLGQ